MTRICIYPKDVQVVTGKSERYARELINEIKRKVGKQKYQLLSVEEFCTYVGLKEEHVMRLLK